MRDKNGRFLPDISGNPRDRPREVNDVREMACNHTEEAMETLVVQLHRRYWIVATASPWRSQWT